MKILVTGNMGYIGPRVIKRLRTSFPSAKLIGLDMGYFANCLTNSQILPECMADMQYFVDVRKIDRAMIRDIDAIVHLAAISNDPMGKAFEGVTMEINHRASVNLAKIAKEEGVKSYVFASSCSIYGTAEGDARTENSPLNPLTAYAKSKVFTERDLQSLASNNFKVTCLRFATACGMSERLRLDLVLNDFVACAVTTGKISILSDGTPWRPLINVNDMAMAIEWAVGREVADGGEFLAVNTGSDDWNYQVKDLAATVACVIEGVELSINKEAVPDKRSYKVNFDLFKSLAPNHQPEVDLKTSITELKKGLYEMKFDNADFRNSRLMRLKALKDLRDKGLLSDSLEWQAT